MLMHNKKKKNITTEAHFKIFVQECKYWQKYFGLYGYDIRYYHGDTDGLASTRLNENRSERVATISLNSCWKYDAVEIKQIRLSAFHEIIELLTWRIGDLIANANGECLERDIFHELIRIFENTLFEEHYNRRYNSVRKKK